MQRKNMIRPVNDDKRSGISLIGQTTILLDGTGVPLEYDRYIDRMTTARSGETLMVDTTLRSFLILLDPSPTEGDVIRLIDAKGNFPKNPLYIDSVPHLVNGQSTQISLDRGLIWEFIFSESSGWTGSVSASGSTLLDEDSPNTGISLEQAQTAASRMVARYDNDSNGSYVVSGMGTTYVHDSGEKHVFSVGAGMAHIRGIEVTLESTRRLEIDQALDLKIVLAEPQSFTTDKYYTLRHGRVHSVQDVSGIKPSSEDVVHGPYNTAPDTLSNQPVVAVSSVVQGGTTFVKDTDYALDGDSLLWDLGGATPSPGSTYTVTYTYQSSVTPTISEDETQIYVAGLAEGTPFYVDYKFFLLRQDRVILTLDGEVQVLKGVPAENTPKAPLITEGLSLARVAIERSTSPIVSSDFIKSLPMSTLQKLFDRVNDIDYNLSILSLQQNVSDQDRTTDKRGLFVEPFKDDDLRDDFFDQRAFIVEEGLFFGTEWATESIYVGNRITLPYTEQPHIQQLAWSEDSLIEPYAWASAPPARLRCTPRTYSWVALRQYDSEHSERLATGRNHGGQAWAAIMDAERGTNYFEEDPPGWYPNGKYQKVFPVPIAKVPPITLTLTGYRFNGDEACDVYFDGMLIQTTAAQADGQFTDTFNVPENTVTGRKEIKVVGQDSGVIGLSFFTAQAQGILEVSKYIFLYDPVAETFTPHKNAFISSIEVQFGGVPTEKVTLHLVQAQLGLPDRTKGLDSVDKEPEDIVPNAWSKYVFDPIPVAAETEYAMIAQTADPAALIHTATMGKWDKANAKHIQTQPYEEGVYLESSNISTWNAKQNKDLTFKINRAVFEPTSTIKLGEVSVVDCTDVQLLLRTITYPETQVDFKLILVDRANEECMISPTKIAVIAKYTGVIEVWATLTTLDDYLSPVLSENIYLGIGKLVNPSDYVSREFSLQGSNRLDVYLDLFEEAGATALIYYRSSGEGDTAVWAEIPRQEANPIGDSYYETRFSVTSLTVESTQLKIVYSTSDDLKRIAAKNLRSVFIVD